MHAVNYFIASPSYNMFSWFVSFHPQRVRVIFTHTPTVRFFGGVDMQTGQSASDTIVRIQPLVEELADEVVELGPDHLEKYLKIGGHVRVIDGRFVLSYYVPPRVTVHLAVVSFSTTSVCHV